ncbi:MAG: ABC transporter substrate-binding protein [Syntrophorhabdales bacterium]|jgi:branched-chain amino acid transport system substrate-binding protein
MREKKLSVTVGSVCAVLFLAVMVLPATGLSAGPEKSVTIGYIGGLSGFSAQGETCMENGAKVAGDWINDNGGITVKGEKYRINVVSEDHKSNSDGAMAAASKLVNDQKVKFIAGAVMPFTNIAINSVTEPGKVIHVAVYNVGTPDEFGPTTPYTFVAHNGTVEGINMMLDFIVKQHPEVKKIAFIDADDGSIPHVQPRVSQACKRTGLTMLGDIVSYSLDTVDFTPITKRALARNPDAIAIVNGWSSMIGGVLRTARQSGFNKPIFDTNGQPAEDIPTAAGKENVGTYYIPSWIIGDPHNKSLPVGLELQRRLKAKYGHELIYGAGMGFDAIWMITQAIEAAQSFDPTAAKTKWETMKTMKSVFGTARLGGLKTYGINHYMTNPQSIVTYDSDGVPKVVTWMDPIAP